MSGGKPIAFIVIDEKGAIVEYDEEVTNGLVQGIVGGDFEVIQPTDLSITMFVATEGKSQGLLPNWRATRLGRTRMRPSDFIVGRVVVTGLPDEEGDVRALSPEMLAFIKEKTS